MIIRSYICNGRECRGKEVPSLDHWRKGECPRPPMPLRLLLATVRHQLGDKAHAGGNITATRLLACSREIGILDNIPIRLAPERLNSMMGGHAFQRFADDFAEEGDYTRIRFPLPGQSAPIILGIPVSGELDYLSPDTVIIEDMKVHSESAQLFRVKAFLGMLKEDNNREDYRAQLSIYARIVRQCVPGADPKVLRIYDGAMVSSNKLLWRDIPPLPWVDHVLPEMTDAELATHRPKGGEATVTDIIADYLRFQERRAAQPDEPVAVAIKATLPLRGRTMMNRKKCASYCLARGPCDAMEGIG